MESMRLGLRTMELIESSVITLGITSDSPGLCVQLLKNRGTLWFKIQI